VSEAPVVAALGLLTAGMAVARAEAGAIALPGLAGPEERPGPENTAGPLGALR
jgi:hypothetical protein